MKDYRDNKPRVCLLSVLLQSLLIWEKAAEDYEVLEFQSRWDEGSWTVSLLLEYNLDTNFITGGMGFVFPLESTRSWRFDRRPQNFIMVTISTQDKPELKVQLARCYVAWRQADLAASNILMAWRLQAVVPRPKDKADNGSTCSSMSQLLYCQCLEPFSAYLSHRLCMCWGEISATAAPSVPKGTGLGKGSWQIVRNTDTGSLIVQVHNQYCGTSIIWKCVHMSWTAFIWTFSDLIDSS